jgi:hypothetical protein
MDARHLIGDVLDFLVLYGDRFAAACFAVALIIVVPVVVHVVRAVLRPLAALRFRSSKIAAVAPTAGEDQGLPG